MRKKSMIKIVRRITEVAYVTTAENINTENQLEFRSSDVRQIVLLGKESEEVIEPWREMNNLEETLLKSSQGPTLRRDM